MFRAVQMSGPNCWISLGLTFNDVVLCRYKTMKTLFVLKLTGDTTPEAKHMMNYIKL